MTNFRTRINKLSDKSRIILANDYDFKTEKLQTRTIDNIKKLNKHLCGIKFNFHLLLPLGIKEISKINKVAHDFGLETIADIKLNDIGNTNRVTSETLWDLGFDAVIVNPIMGSDSLKNIISEGHKKNKGVITLCHMSAPEAESSYSINIKTKNSKIEKRLYQLFLDWSILQKADGIIVGATFPKIIKYCKERIQEKLDIYSPGIGTQGGSIKNSRMVGSDFFIVGRTILDSKEPLKVARALNLSTIE